MRGTSGAILGQNCSLVIGKGWQAIDIKSRELITTTRVFTDFRRKIGSIFCSYERLSQGRAPIREVFPQTGTAQGRR